MTNRPSARGSRAVSSKTEMSSAARQLHSTLAALHTGATAMAAVGGLALYSWLSEVHIAAAIAVCAGLVFALLGRFAVISLGREWLLRTAMRHQSGHSPATTTRPVAPGASALGATTRTAKPGSSSQPL